MKKPIWVLIFGAMVLAGGWWSFGRGGSGGEEIEYRYEALKTGELVRSISATGQLVPLTQVDIRSKAGGKIVALKVEEGTRVQSGDIIALIDPADTQATYDQAQADVNSSQARADQARLNASLERRNRETGLEDAKVALDMARIRLSRSIETTGAQPALSGSELSSAQAGFNAATEALKQLEDVEIPRLRKEAQTGVDSARVAMDNARAEWERQKRLFEQEFVAKAAVERAQTSFESARSSHGNAQERLRTIETEIGSRLREQRARVSQADATLRQAKANQNRIPLSKQETEEARKAVRQAELDLQRAQTDLANARIREYELRSAEAGTVRSRVQLQNAKVQLDSTTVTAPREGVVTMKYLEEGTIIPPGTSTFSQGTAIVQLSDTSRMFVECAVDEADIAQVKLYQNVKVLVEAHPGVKLNGKVTRIYPSARTEQNITAVKVRVEVEADAKVQLMPGLNATCEFLTLEKKDVLVVPQQAVQQKDGKSIVRIKDKEGKPTEIEVKLGEEGNDGFEVLSGLSAGQEVVVAEINVKQIKEIQQKMLEAQQGGGGGLMGGQRPGGTNRSFAPGASSGGGAGGGGGGGGASRGGTGGR